MPNKLEETLEEQIREILPFLKKGDKPVEELLALFSQTIEEEVEAAFEELKLTQAVFYNSKSKEIYEAMEEVKRASPAQKREGKSFFDMTEQEKREICEKAAQEANEEQEKLVRKYEAQKREGKE